MGIYRVLYASTRRVATFVECLAYFRPDIEVIAELADIAGEDGDDLRNWAIFEPTTPGVIDVVDLHRDDQDLVDALALHGLTLE